MLSRDAEVVGRPLGRERLVLGHDDDGPVVDHEPDEPGEVAGERGREVDAAAVAGDEGEEAGPGEGVGERAERGRVDLGGVEAVRVHGSAGGVAEGKRYNRYERLSASRRPRPEGGACGAPGTASRGDRSRGAASFRFRRLDGHSARYASDGRRTDQPLPHRRALGNRRGAGR